MAITKVVSNDAVVRGDYMVIHQEKTKIKEDSKIVSTKISNSIYNPDSDWSTAPAKIKTVCDTHFTSAIKTAWTALSESEQDTIKNS